MSVHFPLDKHVLFEYSHYSSSNDLVDRSTYYMEIQSVSDWFETFNEDCHYSGGLSRC